MEFAKKSVGFLGCAALLASTVWMAGCSDSSSEAAEDDDTRLSIQGFLAHPPEPTEHFVPADNAVIREALNKASFSFVWYGLDELADDPFTSFNDSPNSAVITWPMLAHLPLMLLPAQGATAAELEENFAELGSVESLLGFTHLLRETRENESILPMQNHVWWQADASFESDFLTQFDAIVTPEHHTFDFRQADVEDDVQTFLGGYYGSGFASVLESLADTRVIALQTIEEFADFADSGFEVEPFAGALLTGYHGITLDVPMLRIRGSVDRFENSALVAHRISLSSAGVNLISIRPKLGQFQTVLENVESTYAAMNSAWTAEQVGTMILPVMTSETTIESLSLAEWRGMPTYSEVYADLRGMDHHGGLYIQGEDYISRFAITQDGVELSAVNAHAVTFSDENETYNPPSWLAGSWTFINAYGAVTAPPVFTCEDSLQPDLSESIFIVEDGASGLVQGLVRFTQAEDESLTTCATDDFDLLVTEEELLNGL